MRQSPRAYNLIPIAVETRMGLNTFSGQAEVLDLVERAGRCGLSDFETERSN